LNGSLLYFGLVVIYARFSSPGKTNKGGELTPQIQKENPPFSLPV